MAQSLKILLIVAIAGIILYVARTGIVQQMLGMALSSPHPPVPTSIPKIFPFPMDTMQK